MVRNGELVLRADGSWRGGWRLGHFFKTDLNVKNGGFDLLYYVLKSIENEEASK